jgi:hypothetical protein
MPGFTDKKQVTNDYETNSEAQQYPEPKVNNSIGWTRWWRCRYFCRCVADSGTVGRQKTAPRDAPYSSKWQIGSRSMVGHHGRLRASAQSGI